MDETELFTCECVVKPEWIDYNGHMNMGFYLVAFDWVATNTYFDFLDIGVSHLEKENKSTFTLAANIDYIQEVVEGDRLRFVTQVMDYDHKRLHYIHSMYHAEEGYLASTNECLTLYVDMATRRSTEFSSALQSQLAQQLELGNKHGVPERFARKLGIRR